MSKTVEDLEAEVAELRQQVNALADLVGGMLGNVSRHAGYKLAGGLAGAIEDPQTASDHFARALARTGNL